MAVLIYTESENGIFKKTHLNCVYEKEIANSLGIT